jgi:HK97 family phage major capsid protein
MKRNQKRKPSTSPAAKSYKMGADELGDMIKNAVKEALGEGEEEDEKESDEETAAGGDIAGIIEAVLADVLEKRKARKEAGEEVADDTLVEEVIEAVNEYLEGEGEDEGEKSDDDEDEEEKTADGREEPADADGEKRKSGRRPAQRKMSRRTGAVKRKYTDIYIPTSGTASSPNARNEKKIPPEIQLARAVKCLDVFGRHDPEMAAYYARKHYGDERMEREFKALSATVPSSGGYLIPEVYLDEIIELLYSKTVIFELGARKVPMPNGNLNIPKMTSGTRATWGGEARKITKTQPSFGNVKLSAKRLEAIVPQTRELLMSTNYSADAIFAQDLTRRMELGLDWGALFGTGGEFQPLGVMNTKGITIIDMATLGSSNPELADTNGKLTADFPVYIRSAVLAKNVDDLAMGWAFNSMMEGYLMNLKTTTGAYIYRDEMNTGKLLGFPYKISNQIATDANKTAMFFGNWADLLIGEQLGLETYTTLDGSWTDEDGTQHNAFEENLTATRALMYVDTAVRHIESFAYVKNCKIA